MSLPIDILHEELTQSLNKQPLVVSSPTGSGKSTQVPRWCPSPVLVVEPRRVACRSLAQRVASLEQTRLGTTVGYHVRDERVARHDTRVLFVTPGIALRSFEQIDRYATVILDEFHERRLDVDLLLALLVSRGIKPVVMSATMDGDRVAAYLGGTHLHAVARTYPVDISHHPGKAFLPDPRGLIDRLASVTRNLDPHAGDVLVFLPGKGEINQALQRLEGHVPFDVFPLHGGLTLERQSRVFSPSSRSKLVLATNVAETSLTIPGVTTVIDSGLVRRTRYHQGRGYLTLTPVAMDSADQRAGRAGRTAPGQCIRLWSPRARLQAVTPPEMHRESLSPLVLSAAACGQRIDDLTFLDPPKPHAIEAAVRDLRALGAIDDTQSLTARGRQLFGLPLDPWLGRLLIEAKACGSLQDTIDLVAAVSLGRPLFVGRRPVDTTEDLRRDGCDATALIRAVRDGQPNNHGLSGFALREARVVAERLRRVFDIPRPRRDVGVNREGLVRTALRADPRCCYVARERRGRVAWNNGGAEVQLARESAVHDLKNVKAIVVFDTRALGVDARKSQVIATCASEVPLRWLVDEGLGREHVAEARIEQGELIAEVQRVYAKRIIHTQKLVPTGQLARDSMARLFLAGKLFPVALDEATTRLEQLELASRLAKQGAGQHGEDWQALPPPTTVEDWIATRLQQLGVETGEDIALLTADDLLPPALPERVAQTLQRDYPLEIHLGDARFHAEYDLRRRQVLLHVVSGHRKKAPPRNYLPKFPGLKIFIEIGGSMVPV